MSFIQNPNIIIGTIKSSPKLSSIVRLLLHYFQRSKPSKFFACGVHALNSLMHCKCLAAQNFLVTAEKYFFKVCNVMLSLNYKIQVKLM